MRYIPLSILRVHIFADAYGREVRARLVKAHKKLAKMKPAKRKKHIKGNGSNKWKPVKDSLTKVLGKKCWYTEVELIGAPLVIDHFRPVCFYWWLTYDIDNYRVSCSWANSSEHNSTHGCAGGKGEKFPLRPPGLRAKGKNRLRIEKPVILDPCDAADCELLAFHADGRPVLNPEFSDDPVAAERVNNSKILLNLDHPDFNSKREQLCQEIARCVGIHEALPQGAQHRGEIRAALESKLAPNAPFSTAARFYLRLHRHLDWVENILNTA